MNNDRLINPPRWEGPIQGYLEALRQKDETLLQKLLSGGMPPQGRCALIRTPGDFYGSTYKGFTADSLAVLLGNVDEHNRDRLSGIFVDSGPSIWRVWLMDVSKVGVDSFIRYVWNQSANGGLVTIENINNDLQKSLLANGRGRAARSVIAQLKHLAVGLKIIEIEEERRGRPEKSGNLDNVADDDLVDIYAYLYAKNQRDGHKAPTQYDVAAWLGVDRTTLWRRLKGPLDWKSLQKKGKERADSIPLKELERALHQP